MKKIIIIILILALAGVAIINRSSSEKNKLNKDINTSINNTAEVANTITSQINNDNTSSQNSNMASSNTNINSNNNMNINQRPNQSNNSQNKNSNQVSKNNIKESNKQTNTSSSNNNNNNNNTINISNYMGVWHPTMEAQWNELNNKNEIPTSTQLVNSKLIMTPERYSFNGLTINNPEYKIIPVPCTNIFANAHMGDYGNTNIPHQDGSKIGIPKTPYSPLYYIVAYKKGQSLNSVEYTGNNFMFDYPYILDGQVFALINVGTQPLYKFTKE